MSKIGVDSKTKTDRGETHAKDLEKVKAFHTLAQAADRRPGSDAGADP